MKVSELIAKLQTLDKNLECEVLTDKNEKKSITDVRYAVNHYFSESSGKTEEFKFVLITT